MSPVDAMSHETESGSETATGLSDAAGFRFRLEPDALRAGASRAAGARRRADFTQLEQCARRAAAHLILVRRDLGRLLTCALGAGGAAPLHDGGLTLPTPGFWRVYADFEVDGEKIVLGRDVFVPGEFTPQPLAARRTATVDGYDIRLRRGTDLTFEISRGGRPVSGLQPYLWRSRPPRRDPRGRSRPLPARPPTTPMARPTRSPSRPS